MNYPYFSKNGEVQPTEKAVVSLQSVEYSYGFGVYETLRVSKGRIQFLSAHMDRLQESARIIGLQHTYVTQFVETALQSLLTANKIDTCNVKILLIGAEKSEDAALYIFCSNPLFPDRKLYRDGAHAITYTYERAFPHAKTLNMLQSYLAYREAKRARAYDALLINQRGFVTEGTRTNVFGLQGMTIISPPEDDILLGVMRGNVLRVAREQGFSVEHRDVTLEDLINMDAVFLTSTSTKIMPLRSIDAQTLRPIPEVLRLLMKRFDEYMSN